MRSRIKWRDTLRASTSLGPLPIEHEDHPDYQLTPRTISDSYCEHVLPFASSAEDNAQYKYYIPPNIF